MFEFLDRPAVEFIGDACLFLNMICYQIFCGYLVSELPRDYRSITGRLSMLCFTAALIYLPPRLFYLVEEGKRPVVWLTMLLANSPIILYALFAKAAPGAY